MLTYLTTFYRIRLHIYNFHVEVKASQSANISSVNFKKKIIIHLHSSLLKCSFGRTLICIYVFINKFLIYLFLYKKE